MPATGVIDGQPVNANTFNGAYIPLAEKGAVDGVATLDSNGKVPSSQLTIEALEYKGNFDPTIPSPPLADGVGNTGDMYKVTAAASYDFGAGAIQLNVGDFVLYDGALWDVNKASITSINQIGDVQSISEENGQVLVYNTTNSRYENKNNQQERVVQGAGTFAANFQTINIVSAGQGNITATLPIPVATDEGKVITIMLASNDFIADAITVDSGVRTINGVAGYVIDSGYASIDLYTDGTNWFLI